MGTGGTGGTGAVPVPVPGKHPGRIPDALTTDLPVGVAEREKLIISAQVSTGLIDDVRVAVIPARRHGAIVGGCAPAG